MDKEQLAVEQQKLSAMVAIPESGGYIPQPADAILALDIQYEDDEAHVAGDLSIWQGEHIGTFAGSMIVDVPYAPGYFCFREGPPLLALIAGLAKRELPTPKLIVVDGHGLAHPRKFGAACWVGIATQTPTIGCAKDTLIHYDGEQFQKERGCKVPMTLEDETLGYVVCRHTDVKPVFASPGHLVSIEVSAQIALEMSGPYRVPDPIRRADYAARSHAKGKSEATWENLGKLTAVSAPWE